MPILETGHDNTPATAGTGISAPGQVTKTIVNEPELLERVASRIGDEHVIADAAEGTKQESEMGVMQALKAYPKAVLWSALFSMAIIQEGFDFAMVFSFYALPAFQRRYGEQIADGSYIITPAWQAGLSNAVQVGSIIGLLLNGWACDRFGYRKTLMTALIAIIGFIFITFFAVNLPMLLVGEFLCGIPWGVFQTLTTAYAAEVCPLALRQYLTTYVNLCWVMGQFLSSGVLKGVSTLPEDKSIAYRLPFALQWIWPIPVLIGAYFAPESPWYLVRQGRLDDAADSLRRFGSASGASAAIDIQARVAQMQYTNEFEKAASAGTSYFDCFKGTNLRRTEIVCIVWMIQTACGSPFIGFSNVLYERAGLSVSNAFSLSLGQYALGAVGTISSWWTMAAYGRRPLYLWGCVSMLVTLLIVGGAAFIKGQTGSWVAGSFIFFFSFLYQFTVGPVCYCLVAEVPSTRLRAKSVVLARGAYNLISILSNIIVPRMLSPAAWNWGSKSGFFFAGANVLCIIWIYFRLPETKNRTFVELDLLFEDRVSARNFKTTAVDVFRGHGHAHGDEKEKSSGEYVPQGIH